MSSPLKLQATRQPAPSHFPPWARRQCVRLCQLHSIPQDAEGEAHDIYIYYIYIYIYHVLTSARSLRDTVQSPLRAWRQRAGQATTWCKRTLACHLQMQSPAHCGCATPSELASWTIPVDAALVPPHRLHDNVGDQQLLHVAAAILDPRRLACWAGETARRL